MLLRPALALLAALVLSTGVQAQAKRSEDVVKGTIKAEKPDAEGKQAVTITLDIDKEYHIYANPIGNEDLTSNQTTLTVVSGKAKLTSIEYPKGKLKKDEIIGDYYIYDGKITIKAVLQRTKGETGPIELGVKLMSCTSTRCLQPGTVKLKLEQ